MPLFVHLTAKSANRKTGAIPVSITSAETCPPTCRFRNIGCYANTGPLRMWWRAVTEGKKGTDWDTFCSKITALPQGQLWRHNQAGDLPGSNGVIEARKLTQLVEANLSKRGYTFTHYRPTKPNTTAIRFANQNGFCINLSSDGLKEADQFAELSIAPVVTLVAKHTVHQVFTPEGRRVILCPAQVRENITCMDCCLCAKPARATIVGFLPHGCQAKYVKKIARKFSR